MKKENFITLILGTVEANQIRDNPCEERLPESGADAVNFLGLVVPVGGKTLLITVHQVIDGGKDVLLEVPPFLFAGKRTEHRRAILGYQAGYEVT